MLMAKGILDNEQKVGIRDLKRMIYSDLLNGKAGLKSLRLLLFSMFFERRGREGGV